MTPFFFRNLSVSFFCFGEYFMYSFFILYLYIMIERAFCAGFVLQTVSKAALVQGSERAFCDQFALGINSGFTRPFW